MDEERFLELARDPNHIPGVYNYCDRWCERCDKQEKCLVFAVKQEQGDSGEDLFESVGTGLDIARNLLTEAMEESGLDPEAPDVESQDEPDPFEGIRSHPLVQQAEQYAFGTASRLEPVQHAVVSAAQAVQHKVELGVTPIQGLTLEDLEQCREAVETVLHFRFLICSKIFRALSGIAPQRDGRPDPHSSEDGRLSAQVAWKGIQRSIEAWLTLRNAFPERDAGTLEMLLQLDRLRREVEDQFLLLANPA